MTESTALTTRRIVSIALTDDLTAAVLAYLSANPTLTRTLLMNEEAAEKISVKEAKKEKAKLEHEISALISAFSEKTGLRIEDVSLMPLVSMGEKARYCVNIATNL